MASAIGAPPPPPLTGVLAPPFPAPALAPAPAAIASVGAAPQAPVAPLQRSQSNASIRPCAPPASPPNPTTVATGRASTAEPEAWPSELLSPIPPAPTSAPGAGHPPPNQSSRAGDARADGHRTAASTVDPSTSESDLAEAAANAAQVLRVDLAEPTCYEQAAEALCASELVLAYVHAVAQQRGSGTTEASVWRELLSEGPDHSVAGGALVPRTPPASAHGDMAAPSADWWTGRTEAVKAASTLRSLLRLSLCDDTDLRLARRVVGETKRFFAALLVASEERSVPPSKLWHALDALER